MKQDWLLKLDDEYVGIYSIIFPTFTYVWNLTLLKSL